MNSNDFVSINDILRDVTVAVDDQSYDKGLPKGYYIRQVQQAVEELAFDTYFQTITDDIEYPENNVLEMPSNCFNIKEIYLYNGTCGDPQESRWVYYKRHYNNSQGGDNYTAKRKESIPTDPYLNTGGETNLYYANIENGVIMFSSNCDAYSYVRLVYNGMGSEISEVPLIPRVFRQAVIDFARVKILTHFAMRNPQFRFALGQAQEDMYGMGFNKPGSWKTAQRRIKGMNTWEKENYKEYFSRMNY
jgi:hypothetical protein